MVHSKIHLSVRKITTIAFVVIFLCVSGLVIAYAQNGAIKELERKKAIETIIEVEKKPQEQEKEKELLPIMSESKLIQKCPESWIDNQMPQVVRDGKPIGTTQYLIIEGKRVELSEVDMGWISLNCEIKKQTVY